MGLFMAALLAGCPLARAQEGTLLACTESGLRQALAAGGIYRLECGTSPVSITLTNPLVADRDVSLVATGEVLLNGQNLTRILVVRPGVKVTLQRFLFFNGRQTETNLNSGGIPATAGGAIYNEGGIVTILHGRFEGNQVVGVAGLAGAAESDDAGEPGGDAAGGAIYNDRGQLYIANTVFTANTAAAGAGGNGAAGRGNGGDGGAGGTAAGAAIFSEGGKVVVHTSTFTSSVATGALAGVGGAGTGPVGFPGDPGEAGDAVGAAIAGNGGQLVLLACTLSTNTARAAQGAAGRNGVYREPGARGRNGGEAAGGAIYMTGTLALTNCTLVNNAAISGQGGNGGNSTAAGFGNDGGAGGDGGLASGGAIESTAGGTIIHCTFSGNVVTAGTGGAGGTPTGLGKNGAPGQTGAALGWAVYAGGGEIALANTLLANSVVSLAGKISDRGGNATMDANPLLTRSNSFKGVNPGLAALASNGGPTATMAITSNSIAFNRGAAEHCLTIDQRGFAREEPCDMGAFELVPTFPPIPANILGSFTLVRQTTPTRRIELRWPSGYGNLVLQSAAALPGTNAGWLAVTNAPAAVGTNLLFTVPLDASALPKNFYRLYARTNQAVSNFPPLPLP